jgi:hypothetical protein
MRVLFLSSLIFFMLLLLLKYRSDDDECKTCGQGIDAPVPLPSLDPDFDQRLIHRVYSDNPLRTSIDANPMNWDIFHPTTLIEHSEPVKQAHGHYQHENGRHAVPRAHPDQLVWNRLYSMTSVGAHNVQAALWAAADVVQKDLQKEGYRGFLSAHDVYVHNPGPIGTRSLLIKHGLESSYSGVVVSIPSFVEVLHA